jgi:hypothetical protein
MIIIFLFFYLNIILSNIFYVIIYYSLYAVLYPTGITGELGCMYHIITSMYESKVSNK